MDIVRLPQSWRLIASECESRPVDTITLAYASGLLRCADQLELAWHQHAHDGAFEDGCRFCDWEREHNDNYPEEEGI